VVRQPDDLHPDPVLQVRQVAVAPPLRDLLTSTVWVRDRAEFFPRLQHLTIEGDASLCLMETLLSSITDLASLSIFVHSFSVPSGQFDAMILQQVRWRRGPSPRPGEEWPPGQAPEPAVLPVGGLPRHHALPHRPVAPAQPVSTKCQIS
jgi:hypothetical protein